MRADFATRAGRYPEVLSLLILLAIDAVWAAHAGLSFGNYGAVAAGASTLLALGIVYGYTGRSKRLSDMGYFGALFIFSGMLTIVLSYLAAQRAIPLYDAQLSALDSALGFDWRRWHAFVHAHPVFDTVLGIAYASLLPQIPLTVFLLAHRGRTDRNRELFWTILTAALVTTAMFYAFPASGPFAYFSIDLGRAIHLKDFLQLRSGAPGLYSLPDLQGIIAFPSFHTVLALIFMHAHRGLRASFIPFVLLNGLMLVSTPSHGGHYLTDMIGGAVVALASIALVRQVMARHSTPQSDHLCEGSSFQMPGSSLPSTQEAKPARPAFFTRL
jgi:hypothetical protein